MSTGGITKPKQKNSVIGMFRRESSASGNGPTAGDSDSSTNQAGTPVVVRDQMRNKRSASISGTGIYDVEAGGHAGQFPVTASHRRNTRKGSLLELSGYVFIFVSTSQWFHINKKRYVFDSL